MAVSAAKLAALSYCWRLLPGLQLLEVIVAGKNQNGLIRNMHLQYILDYPVMLGNLFPKS